MSRIIINGNNNNENEIPANNAVSAGLSEQRQPVIDEFAASFPDWNLVPPLQVIKRVRRSL